MVFLNNLDKYRLEKSLTYFSPPDIAWINSVFLKKYCWNVFRDIYESTSAYHYVLLVPPGSFFVHWNICMPCIHTAHPVMNTTKIWRQVNFFFSRFSCWTIENNNLGMNKRVDHLPLGPLIRSYFLNVWGLFWFAIYCT